MDDIWKIILNILYFQQTTIKVYIVVLYSKLEM